MKLKDIQLTDILRIDYLLLLPVLVLIIIGVLFIYSSGVTYEGEQVSNEYVRQIIWATISLFALFAISLINYRRFYNFSMYIYIFALISLLYTLFFGHVIYNASRWIRIGSMGIQMSEFVKIIVIIMLARYLADTDHIKESFPRFLMSCIIVIIPMGMVLLQPDLGTALVYIAILLIMIFIAGVKMRYVAFMISCIVLTGILLGLPIWQTYILQRSISFIVILTNIRFLLLIVLFFLIIAAIAFFGYRKYKKRYFFWVVYAAAIIIFSLLASYAGRIVLKDYQMMRLIVFLNPNVDPRGAGWNIIQSVTAIGSGGFAGRGYLQGTQSHYRFLPEQSTDFIFSIFSEEAGFIGGLFVFALFFLICYRLMVIMKTVTDPFAKYICTGLAGMIGFHFIINVGMTMGIMPITGLPLLFLSYGGSSILSSMIAIGIVQNIYINRFNR